MDDDPSRIRIRCSSPIERGFERRRRSIVCVAIRSWQTGGWHLARAQFARDLLPGLCVAADAVDIECVKLEASGLEPAVVAGPAVAIENRTQCSRAGRRCRWLLGDGICGYVAQREQQRACFDQPCRHGSPSHGRHSATRKSERKRAEVNEFTYVEAAFRRPSNGVCYAP